MEQQIVREAANEGKPANERFTAYVLARMETLGIDPERLTARDFFKILSDIYFLPAVDQDAPRDREAEYTAMRRSEAIRPLLPFLLDEFEAAEESGEIEAGATFEEVVREGFTAKGSPSKKSRCYEIIRRAQDRQKSEVLKPYGKQAAKVPFIGSALMDVLTGVYDQLEYEQQTTIYPDEKNDNSFIVLTLKNKAYKNGTFESWTAFDKLIYGAIAGIYDQAEAEGVKQIVITAKTVAANLPGVSRKPDRLQKIEESIQKIRNLYIEADFTRFCTRKNTSATYEENAIFAGKTTIQGQRGTEWKAWVIRAEPLLLRNAEDVGGVTYIPRKMLDVDCINMTETALNLLFVMAAKMQNRLVNIKKYEDRIRHEKRRIEAGKEGQEKPRELKDLLKPYDKTVKFETLFREAGIDPDKLESVEAKRLRDVCRSILEYWVKVGYINSFRFEQKGVRREITGYTVE